MKKTATLLLALSFICFHLSAQEKHDYQWLMGHPPASFYGLFSMNFNDSLHFEEVDTQMEMSNGQTSICDDEGRLIFYTNGCWIANAEHEMMLRGDSLNFGDDNWSIQNYNSRCEDGFGTGGIWDGPYYHHAQVIQRPDSEDQYYMFHYRLSRIDDFSAFDLLQYTRIDMSLDNGLGGVVEKNIPILDDTLIHQDVNMCKHANGRDWWLLSWKRDTNLVFRFLITPDDIQGPYTQTIGKKRSRKTQGSGQESFSPDGTRFAYANPLVDHVFLYDFDRETGLLSNFQQIERGSYTDSSYTPVALSFSPNSCYLYTGHFEEIWQLDLQADDIIGSAFQIAEYNGLIDTLLTNPSSTEEANFGPLLSGPDCRIYVLPGRQHSRLSIIDNPNDPGPQVNFLQHAARLPAWLSIGTGPDYPYYRLGTDYPICDSTIAPLGTIVSTHTPPVGGPGALGLSPNPCIHELQVAFPRPLREGQLLLINTVGQVVRQEAVSGPAWRWQLGDLPAGLYQLVLQQEGRVVAVGKVVKE